MYHHRTQSGLSLSKPMAMAVFGGLVVTGFYLLNEVGTDKSGMSLLYLLGLIQITPITIGLILNRFNYLDFILVNHFTVLTVNRLNVIHNLEYFEALPPDAIAGLQELVICSMLIAAGYWITRHLFYRGFFRENVYETMAVTWERQLIVLGILVAFPFIIRELPPGVIIPIFSGMSVLFVLLFTSDFNSGRGREIWTKAVLLCSAFHFFIVSGFMTLLGQYAGVAFVTSCLKRRTQGFVGLVPLVLMLSVIQSVKNDYRIFLADQPIVDISTGFQAIAGLVGYRYFSDVPRREEDKTRDLAQGFSRIGDNSLELVLAQTPSQVPFWGGETYATIPFMFIPRFLWPEKPSRDFWNKFGHLYGVLSEDDDQTSVGVGFLAEAYMNFGFIGLYGLSFFFGVFVVMVERFAAVFFSGRTILTFLVFLIPLMSYSSDLGSMLNSLFVAIFVMTVFRLVVSTAKRDAYGVAQ